MADQETLTVTLPADVAAHVKDVLAAGEYGSLSELVATALRDWSMARESEELSSLKADLAEGLADIEAGRVEDFDADRIIALGRKLLAERSPSV